MYLYFGTVQLSPTFKSVAELVPYWIWLCSVHKFGQNCFITTLQARLFTSASFPNTLQQRPTGTGLFGREAEVESLACEVDFMNEQY
jgi:hypothetical protein